MFKKHDIRVNKETKEFTSLIELNRGIYVLKQDDGTEINMIALNRNDIQKIYETMKGI